MKLFFKREDRNLLVCRFAPKEGSTVVFIGADGTGKTYLAKKLRDIGRAKSEIIKFDRAMGSLWATSAEFRRAMRMVPKENMATLFDRHPYFDWPVYEAVRQNLSDVAASESFRQWAKAYCRDVGHVSVIWLRNQCMETKVGRDLDFVVGREKDIDHMYELFFNVVGSGHPVTVLFEEIKETE